MTTEAVVLDATAYSAKLAELANIFVDPATKKPLPYAAGGREALREQRLRTVPLDRRLARHRPDVARALQVGRGVLRRPAGLHAFGRRQRRQVGRLPPRARSSTPARQSSKAIRT